ERPEGLGKNLSPPRVNEQRGIPRRQEPGGRGGAPAGQRRAREVEQLLSLLVAEPAQRQALRRGTERRHRHAGPVGGVSQPRRAEAAEVAPEEVLERPLLFGRRGAEPVVRRREEVRPAAIPGSGGRNPDEID